MKIRVVISREFRIGLHRWAIATYQRPLRAADREQLVDEMLLALAKLLRDQGMLEGELHIGNGVYCSTIGPELTVLYTKKPIGSRLRFWLPRYLEIRLVKVADAPRDVP